MAIYLVLAYATLLTFYVLHAQRVAMTDSIKSFLGQTEKRILAQLDDLQAAAGTIVTGVKAIADSNAELGAAVTDISTYIKTAPVFGDPEIAKVTEQLSGVGQQLLDSAAKQHEFATSLEALAHPAAGTGTDTGAAVSTTIAVGSTVAIPSDPSDPKSATVDHTVTAIAADGTITSQPAAPPQDGGTSGASSGDAAASAKADNKAS